MPCQAPVIALVLLCGLCLPLGYAYVMGPDNRQPVIEANHDNPAIRQTGMIRIRGEEFVSGLLMGENCDVVLSAGHAAIYWQDVERRGWKKGQLRGRGDFRFSLDPGDAGSWQGMALVASGYEDGEQVGKDEHDWSIFRTRRPVQAQCEGLPVKRTRSCQAGLLMPGFHFDKPQTRLLDQSCSLKRYTNSGIIVHDCDTKDGSSGAPLFCRDGETPGLLGINISGLTNRDYYDAGVYGKAGRAFDDRRHKNFAIAIDGEFYRELMRELKRSKERSLLKDE